MPPTSPFRPPREDRDLEPPKAGPLQTSTTAIARRPRLRILPVPGPPDGRFVLVFDRVPLSKVAAYRATADDLTSETGAAQIVVIPDDIDVPQAFDPREVY